VLVTRIGVQRTKLSRGSQGVYRSLQLVEESYCNFAFYPGYPLNDPAFDL
jgi:hypothetical protein